MAPLSGRWCTILTLRCGDAKVYYDTTTSVSGHYSETTFALSAQIKVLGKQIAYISQNLQHQSGPGHTNTVEYTYFDESDEDEPSEADKSEIDPLIDPLIRESSDTFLMGDEKIALNPLEDSDELVPIPRNEESDEPETKTIMEEDLLDTVTFLDVIFGHGTTLRGLLSSTLLFAPVKLIPRIA
ncbi:hypothetical protein Tco_0748902 [Tanacetum coccineum]|uniref:Uncharacterized protein n=1 Tax=Tanacetum coccineum TaxID=301880 RepID=A0ABQ4YY46_9ASTR